jgi:uncharacterized protein (DUF924 family)
MWPVTAATGSSKTPDGLMSRKGHNMKNDGEGAYRPVLDFWFRELVPSQWFRGGPELDETIRQRFGALLEQAKQGALDGWAATPRGLLVLIIVLDQFPRNIFRGRPEAFAEAAKAEALSQRAIAQDWDKALALSERQFLYMPLMHAEDPGLQRLSLEKFADLKKEAEGIFQFAQDHADIVARFGRFPGRNQALGREPTPEEQAFLASGKGRF